MNQQTESKSILDNPRVIKRGISYCRVSTDEQADKGYSLPTQLKEIQAYAAKSGIELVANFYDDFTGSSLDRPGLVEARQWLSMGRADCILCLDSDRLTREPGHYMQLRDEFNSQGVELHYCKRGQVDLNDFGQMLVEDFYGRFAHEWKRKLVEATTRGRRGKVEAGNVMVHVHPPYGYTLATVDGLQTLIVNNEQAQIVKAIFHWYVREGLSANAIVRRLTEAKVPTWADEVGKRDKKQGRGVWSDSTIARILSDELYRGRWYYAKSSDAPILVNVPVIVDAETWKLAQERRAENRERKRKEPKREYLMAGRNSCHICQAPAHGKAIVRKSKNGKKSYLYYQCAVARSKEDARVGVTCHAPNFRVDLVDTAVWNWIKNLLLYPERLQQGLEEYQQSKAAEAAPLREDLARLEKLAGKKRQALARAKELYYDGILSKAEFAADKKAIEVDLADLEAQAAKIKDKLETISLSPERIQNILDFAERVRLGCHLAEKEVNFDVRKQIITLLDVRAELAVENGQQVAHASCVLDTRALPLSSLNSRNDGEQVQSRFIITARLELCPE